MACVIDTTGHPDWGLVRDFCQGFPVYGSLPHSGVFAQGEIRATRDVADVLEAGAVRAWKTRLLASVQQRGDASMKAGGDSQASAEAVWAATAKELSEGWVDGVCMDASARAEDGWRGYFAKELAKHPWMDWRHEGRWLRRFGVLQKGAWRPIDDGSENVYVTPQSGNGPKPVLSGNLPNTGNGMVQNRFSTGF